ncbi:MAG TPA: TauD/TfdA family dioxygenase [Gemmatimonadales bacterium]|nr:TauD/TfdA family dioxygenase [Gemmatimonadales bacterium]
MRLRTPAARHHAELEAPRPPILGIETPDDPARWAAEHREELRSLVRNHGAVLVRGLELCDAAGAEAVFHQLGTLMVEREGFAARRRYADGVYSSSKWPPNQAMCLHHELSYSLQVPELLLFACLVAPYIGGATPLADSQPVLASLPRDLVEHFERAGWLLIRNYREDVGTTVSEAFGTDDRNAVERYCRDNDIRFEWGPGGALRTWQRRSAIVRHPVTGGRCWFNQAAFLNAWTMDPEVREYLVDVYGKDALPFDTCFGDGEPIGADQVRVINEAFEANATREPWHTGDLMIVDNIRTAHGRDPFEGEREMVVALANAVSVTAAP